MIYTFQSEAAGNLIMLGPQGDQLLQTLGRAPAAKGIFEAQDLPALLAKLETAMAGDVAPGADEASDSAEGKPVAVALRARLWPMVEMMRLANQAGKPIVWGV
jgi:hypothetical protein